MLCLSLTLPVVYIFFRNKASSGRWKPTNYNSGLVTNRQRHMVRNDKNRVSKSEILKNTELQEKFQPKFHINWQKQKLASKEHFRGFEVLLS